MTETEKQIYDNEATKQGKAKIKLKRGRPAKQKGIGKARNSKLDRAMRKRKV